MLLIDVTEAVEVWDVSNAKGPFTIDPTHGVWITPTTVLKCIGVPKPRVPPIPSEDAALKLSQLLCPPQKVMRKKTPLKRKPPTPESSVSSMQEEESYDEEEQIELEDLLTEPEL